MQKLKHSQEAMVKLNRLVQPDKFGGKAGETLLLDMQQMRRDKEALGRKIAVLQVSGFKFAGTIEEILANITFSYAS